MDDDRPTFGSLFAGIGGIDLGLERAGWRGRWQVEYEPFCTRVLERHWPDVQRYGDIHNVDWSGVERVDLVAGGFPCQPVSLAGNRQVQADDRWLWPEFARCLRALRPRYVLVENVPGLLVGGGMDDVLGGLAELGYDTEWESIPAAAVGAPHLRYRVWIVAYAGCFGVQLDGRPGEAPGSSGSTEAEARQWQRSRHALGDGRSPAIVADASVNGRGSGRAWRLDPIRPGQPEHALPDVADAIGQRGRGRNDHREHAADVDAPGQGIGPRGYGDWWATEPDVGRVAHGVPARVDRLRSLGNAVVPQVVEFIGRRILEAEAMTTPGGPE